MEFAAENKTRISKYVNVCVAVCLLLLVGVLTPTSAAPHLLQTKDSSEKPTSDQENEIWSNPCIKNKPSGEVTSVLNKPGSYEPRLAKNVAMQLRDTKESAKGYQYKITNLTKGVNSSVDIRFEDLLKMWQNTSRLQIHLLPKFSNDVLPENKKFGTPIDDKFIDENMRTYTKLTQVLPLFSKTMKMLGAALRSISRTLNEMNENTYGDVKRNLEKTSNSIRHVVCLTNRVIRSLNLQILPLNDSEIPQYSGLSTEDVEIYVFLIYCDTVNFLEYFEKFFDKLSKLKENSSFCDCHKMI